VTATTIVQVDVPFNTPFANVIELVVLVTVPPHWGEAGGVETVSPGGKVSVIPIPTSCTLPPFSIVIVSVVPEPAEIGFGEKSLLRLTPDKLVNEAEASCGFVAPFVVVTAPAGMVLVRLLITFIVTLRVREQLAKGNKLPPLNENEVLPGVALIVPPQLPTERFGGLAMLMPPPTPWGKLSVNAIPVSDMLLLVPGLIN
jgi:hypothetical protein